MYKTKKEIVETLNGSMFGFDYNRRTRPYRRITKPLTDNDIYIVKGWIFVNLKAIKSVYKLSGIDVYRYPLNEYCESYGNLFYMSNKSFKDYVDTEVDFSGEYPREKNPPRVTMVSSKVTRR